MTNHQNFLTVIAFLSIAALVVSTSEYDHQAKAKVIGYSVNCSNDKCYTQTINSTSPQSSPQSQNKVIGSRTVCINDNPCSTEPINSSNSTNIHLGSLPFSILP